MCYRYIIKAIKILGSFVNLKKIWKTSLIEASLIEDLALSILHIQRGLKSLLIGVLNLLADPRKY